VVRSAIVAAGELTEPDRHILEQVGALGSAVLQEAAAPLSQQAEVDLLGVVVDHDHTVEHRRAPSQRRSQHAGQFGELDGEVEPVAAGQQCRSVRSDPHRDSVTVQPVLMRLLRPFPQAAAVRLGQRRAGQVWL